MKLGFATLGAPDWPLEKVAETAARTGYDGLELRGVDRQHLDPSMTPGERAEVRRILDDAGLDAVAVTAYVRLTEPGRDASEAAETIGSYVELARDVGAPRVRLFGGRVPDGEDRETAEARVAECLESVAPAAGEAGVRLCLETHDAFRTGADVARVLREVDHPAVEALWDVHHPYTCGETLLETLDLLWPRIGYLHVKDSFPMPDGERQRCLLGAGDVPVREAIELLKGRGFGGYLVVEWEKPWHPELAEADVAMAQHIWRLRPWIDAAEPEGTAAS